jgi:hypothetical protein
MIIIVIVIGWNYLSLVIHPDNSQRLGECFDQSRRVDNSSASEQSFDPIFDEVGNLKMLFFRNNPPRCVQVCVPVVLLLLSRDSILGIGNLVIGSSERSIVVVGCVSEDDVV